jgi:predicted CopG family antitoxin
MPTKTIRVSEEVYDRLKTRKRDDESFTDLLDRLVEQERDIYAGFGAWEEAAEEMEKTHERMNEEMEEEVEKFKKEQ